MADQSFTYPASDGEVFEQTKWDAVVGLSSPLDRGKGGTYSMTVASCVIAEDGRSVAITVTTDAVLTPNEQALIGFALRQKCA